MTVTNCYLIKRDSAYGLLLQDPSHRGFRTQLINELISGYGKASTATRGTILSTEELFNTRIPEEKHYFVHLTKRALCRVCSVVRLQRTVLGSISDARINARSRRTRYGCSKCMLPICSQGPCWKEHHGFEAPSTAPEDRIIEASLDAGMPG
jgi:hypothetical protein